MIAPLIRFALAHRPVIVAAALVLAGAGVWSFRQLKLEAYPDLTDPTIVVITLDPGFAAEEVERQVTVPIERALNSTPFVIARRSRTIFGLSVVELTFEDGTSDNIARQLVMERLQSASLPEGVTPTLGPLVGGISEFYRYALAGGSGYDAMRLRELQDWVITPRLLQIPGVADVATFGGLVRQYEIQVDPKALDKYRLSVRQVADAVKSNNRNAGGALMRLGEQALPIRGSGLVRSAADVENIVLDAPKGVPVFVRDIGRVQMAALPPTGIFAANDEPLGPGGVEGIVLMRRGENPSQILPRIQSAVDELNATRLPGGVRIVPIYDRSELVQNTLRTVSRVLLEGFVIVLTVLFVFLLDLRAAVLTAIIIPLSLLFALSCMYVTGISLSLLSIGALDFGIIVDATIVMVERIMHVLSARREAREGRVTETVGAAALDVQRAIVFSLLIIIAAYLPLLTLQRVERRLFTPMALTVCYALVGSLLFSLTLVPVLATYLFPRGVTAWRHRPLEWLQAGYRRALQAIVPRAVWTVALTALVVVGAIYVGTFLGTEFLPQLDEGVIWIRANLPAGIALEKSAAVAREIRALIRQSPEIKMVISQTGRNDSGTDPFGPNRNELLIDLHPYETWRRGRTKAGLVEELSQRLRANIPGATFNFTQPIIDTATEIVTGSSADLAVIISGPDLKVLRALAAQALAILRGVPGAADTSIEQEADQAQLQIEIDRLRVARYGINVGDVQDLIDLALGGAPITGVFEGERRFDVVARLRPDARSSPGAIAELLIPTRDGARVPLTQLADIRVRDGATIVARRENERAIAVRTNIRGRDQGTFVAEAQALLAKEVKFPPGYSVVWGGQFENFARAWERLLVIVPITMGLIFILLFITFGAGLDAAVVLATVPFSLVGGLMALYFRGMHLNVSAAVGFISLFGVAVMSGVLYISEINRIRRPAGPVLLEAVVQGAQAQFRPVLMVVIIAALGMIPAMVARGIGSDIQRPLATVVVGGLLSTLVLTPLALPAVYWAAAKLGGRT